MLFRGFPPDLFRFTAGIECLNTVPTILVFYKPNVVDD
jgi:hypothetical protein